MVPVKKEEDRPALETVQGLFDGWRKEKKVRDSIPPSLWEAALSLTHSRSVLHDSEAPSAQLYQPQARAEARPAADRNIPTFIEIGPLTVTVKMTKPTGERMTITGNCDVAELARVFFE